MNKRIAFKNMEKSDVIEDFANKQLLKIEKFLEKERSPVSLDLVIEFAPVHAHNKIELRLNAPDYSLVAHHEGPDIIIEIDRVVDKMINEIRKAKDKRVTEKKHNPKGS